MTLAASPVASGEISTLVRTPRWPRGWVFAAALLSLAGCHSGSPTDPDVGSPTDPDGVAQPLPAAFVMIGTANSTESDGSTVSCVLEFYFELPTEPRMVPEGLEYDGTHGGSVQRTVLDRHGNGISLWPAVAGEAVVRSLPPDRVEIIIPANIGVESRFWSELAQFEGRFDGRGQVVGEWNCAPFDLDEGGYVDTRFTARGSWAVDLPS